MVWSPQYVELWANDGFASSSCSYTYRILSQQCTTYPVLTGMLCVLHSDVFDHSPGMWNSIHPILPSNKLPILLMDIYDAGTSYTSKLKWMLHSYVHQKDHLRRCIADRRMILISDPSLFVHSHLLNICLQDFYFSHRSLCCAFCAIDRTPSDQVHAPSVKQAHAPN